MAKMGRPEKPIKWDDLEKLCFLQCTHTEISGFLGISIDTLNLRVKKEFGKTFKEYFAEKSQGGKISIRRKMFQLVEKGNATILIWLSKQHLGMSDKQETDITSGGQPINITYSKDAA